MKLGILGGTFDPIHLGHLRAAEYACEQLRLDQVAFVPAHLPPHRPGPLTSARDRFAMVALATAGNPRFVASDIELRREGPSYSVDTVRELKAERPGDQVVLIVGSDTFAEMGSWKDSDTLFSLCAVAVVDRPGGAAAAQADRAALRVTGAGLPICSSEIRKRAADGRSIRYLVPEAVADYIAKQGLYR